jgi:arginine N-succinyltransferase
MLEPVADELDGMTSLPADLDASRAMCAESAATVADLAAGAFELAEGTSASVLFVLLDGPPPTADRATPPTIVGVTGMTFKNAVRNLAVQVVTSDDGLGLDMLSSSVPWSRTELNSSYVAPTSRGQGFGALLSRGRFMFLHQVQRQVPSTIASHLRGRFDEGGTAPFWECFGSHFATGWPSSKEAERALADDPDRLSDLADRRLPVTAHVLDSLGPVNRASLPAFRLLMQEGLRPNGMYDPIDGGPTLVAELSDTMTSRRRHHGRAVIIDEPSTPSEQLRLRSELVAVTSIDNFRVTQMTLGSSEENATPDEIPITSATARGLGIEAGALLAASPLVDSTEPTTPAGAGEGTAP